MVERECRLQDTDNRQSSLECESQQLKEAFTDSQNLVWNLAVGAMRWLYPTA